MIAIGLTKPPILQTNRLILSRAVIRQAVTAVPVRIPAIRAQVFLMGFRRWRRALTPPL
jgi:hypothetical protein